MRQCGRSGDAAATQQRRAMATYSLLLAQRAPQQPVPALTAARLTRRRTEVENIGKRRWCAPKHRLT